MLTDCRIRPRVRRRRKRRRARGAGRASSASSTARATRSCPANTTASSALPSAASYVYRLRGCACVERDGAYNYVRPDGQLAYPVFYKDVEHPRPEHDPHRTSAGRSTYSPPTARARPRTMSSFAPFPGGDGTLLKARGADGLVVPDRLAREPLCSRTATPTPSPCSSPPTARRCWPRRRTARRGYTVTR